MMNDKSLNLEMVERTIQPTNQNFEPTPTETAVPLSEQIEPPPESSTYQWYVVVICMVAYILSFVDRQILSLMIEPIKADLMLSDTQFSLLHGLAFSLFYAFMGIPIALLADRYSRPRIIAIGVAFWSIATAACGLSKNFVQISAVCSQMESLVQPPHK